MKIKSCIEEYISEIIYSELGIVECSKRKLTVGDKSTWLVECEDNKYIIKTLALINETSLFNLWKKKLLRTLRRTVQREVDVYKQFQNHEFKYFNYPRMISSKSGDYMILEFIEAAVDGWDKDKVSERDAVEALFEFNSSKIELHENFFEMILSNIRRKTICKLGVWSFTTVRNNLGIGAMFSCLGILVRSLMTQKTVKVPFILHRDLIGHNNILTTSDGKLYFLDFESIVSEKRWILNDIVDLSLGLDLEFNSRLFNRYLELLKERTDLSDEIHIKAQVRIALMHRVIRRLLSSNEYSQKHKQKWLFFLKNTLLNDFQYELWYEKNVYNVQVD